MSVPRRLLDSRALAKLVPSSIVLVLVNLVPVVGVVQFDWSVFDLVFLFWAENLIVGIVSIPRILLASGEVNASPSKKMKGAAFFVVHYGGFTLLHGSFVFLLFGGDSRLRDLVGRTVLVPLLALAASHVFSFFGNYVGRREYLSATLNGQFFRPYGRVVALHLAIIGGAFLVQALGSPIYGLLILTAIKTLLDLAAHVLEHLAAQHAKQPADPAGL